MGEVNKIFLRTAKVFALKIFVAIFAFLIQVQLGRMLGMGDYGSFSLFLSVASVISVFPLMGMDSGIIREVASANSKGRRKWCILISLICVVSILLLTGIIMPCVSPYIASTIGLSDNLLTLLLFYLVVLVLNTLAGAVLQGEQRNVLNDGTTALTSMSKVLTIYILGKYDVGLYEVLITYISLEFICTVGRWGIIFYEYKNIGTVWAPINEVRKYLCYCLPLFFVSSIGIIQCSLHRFVTAYYLDAYSVGVLKVCENFSGALSLFVAPFVTTWPVMAAYYKERRLDDIRSMFHKCSVAITAMIMPALTALIICAPELLQLFNLSVTENNMLIVILFVFCLGTVYDAIIGPAGALLKMTEYSRISFYNAAILLVLTIVFSCVLIPHFGLLGAAGALSLSHFVINTLNAWQNYRLFGLMPYGKSQIGLIIWSVPVFGIAMYMRKIINIGDVYNVLIYSLVIYLLFGGFVFAFYKNIREKLLMNMRRIKSAVFRFR